VRQYKYPSNRTFKRLLILTAVTALSLALYGTSQLQPPTLLAWPEFLEQKQPGLYNVISVADGDTITIDLGGYRETVRLIGVDTPETHDPRKPVQCFGEAASNFTKSLLAGQKVRLESEPEDSDRDKYRRLLRYAYLPDGRLVNAEIIQAGYGFAYTVFPYSKLDEFRLLETEARENGRGLWSSCQVDDAKEIKQTQPVS
jgi:micrococcal nuclease